MTASPMMNNITVNTEKNRFEYEKDGHMLYADYRLNDGILYIDYVEAPAALRGTGAAGTLMAEIAAYARRKNLVIHPVCGYAAAWLQRHNARNSLLQQAHDDE
jgi:uncharacterized protein